MDINVGSQKTSGQYGNYDDFQVGSTGFETQAGLVSDYDTIKKSSHKGENQKFQFDPGRPNLPAPLEKVYHLDFVSNFLQMKSTGQNQDAEQQPLSESEQQNVYSDSFHDELTIFLETNNLNSSDQAKLQFAFYNPTSNMANIKLSNGASLSQVLHKLLSNAQDTALKRGVDVSTLSSSVDNADFNLNISDAYNIAFEKSLSEAKLTPQQKATLKFMHYNPDTKLPTDPLLQPMLKGFEDAAMAQTSQEFELPGGWKPDLNSKIYNGVIGGNLKVNVQLAFNKITNGMSGDDISAVKDALQNMDNPNISPKIKEISQKIMDKGIADTKANNHLPEAWQPSSQQVSESTAAGTDPMTNAFVQANEIADSTSTQLTLLVTDSSTVTMDMLTAISEAIINAQNSVYELEMSQSQVSKNESTARLGMMDQQIRERQEEQNQIHHQSKKQHKMGKVMKVLNPIMKVMGPMMALTGGPIGLAVYLLDNKYHFINKGIKLMSKGICEAIDKMIPANGNPGMQRFKDGLKAVAEVAAFSVVLFAAFPALFFIGPMESMTIVQDMITQSSAIQNFCAMCGVPKDDVQWVVLAVNMAFTLTVTIGAIIATGGAAAEVELPAATAEIMEETTVAAEETTQTMNAVLDNVEVTVNLSANVAESSAAGGSEAVSETTSTAEKIAQNTTKTINEMMENALTKIRDNKLISKMFDLLEQLLKNDKALSYLGKAMDVMGAATSGVSAAESGVRAGMDLTNLAIIKAKMKHEPQIVMLQAMLKQLQKVLDNLLKGLSDLGDDLQDLSSLYDNVLSGQEQALNQTTSIQMT